MATAAARIFIILSTPSPLLQPTPFLLRLARCHSRLIPLHTPRSPLLPSPFSVLPPSSPFSKNLHSNAHPQPRSLVANQFHDLTGSALPRASHPWPEWSRFIDRIRADGYFSDRRVNVALYELVSVDSLPGGFLRAANSCMGFARDNASILCSLSRQDVEVVVENGSPFLFRNAQDSARRMKCFLRGVVDNVPDYDKPSTVDLMRFLLSYASIPIVSSEATNLNNQEVIESSVRNLFTELAGMRCTPQRSLIYGSLSTNVSGTYKQTKSFGQNIQMKRGDWICQRCNFMNFARNMNCLECNEPRPKGQLTGGEWECPQCEFYNYGQNMVCMRCDCKKLGADSSQCTPVGGFECTLNSKNDDADERVVENKDKVQQWFSKISQLENTSDTSMSKASESEAFPDIMPLRKGVNQFVKSTRKTPLERKMADEEYRKNMGTPKSNNSQYQVGDKRLHEKITQELGEMLDRGSSVPYTNHSNSGLQNNTISGTSFPASGSFWQQGNPDSVSTVANPVSGATDRIKSDSMRAVNEGISASDNSSSEQAENPSIKYQPWRGRSLEGSAMKEPNPLDMSEEAKAERWFKRVAQIKDISELSQIPDEDFPSIMPMRKGVNRFVVSKRKTPAERRLTSSQYKRNLPIMSSDPLKRENETS